MPSEPLVQGVAVRFDDGHREGKRDDPFDAYLSDKYEPYDVEGRQFQASDILFALDPSSYDDARQEWENRFLEGVAQAFPHPIAHCYHRFQNEESLGRRVDLLLDTFEAVVVLLEALLLGLARRTATSFATFGIGRDAIVSRNLVDRIHVVRQLTAALSPVVAQRIEQNVVQTCDQLREIRNTVAHGSTLDEDAAALLLERTEPLLNSVLKSLSWLGEVELFRHERRLDETERVQVFVGESTSRKMRDRVYSDVATMELRASEKWHIYAFFEDELVLLSPLVIWRKNGNGKSELSSLRKCAGVGDAAQLFYEAFGDCGEQPIADRRLRQELETLKTLFGASKAQRG